MGSIANALLSVLGQGDLGLTTESQSPKGQFDWPYTGYSLRKGSGSVTNRVKVEKLRQRLKRERKEARIVLYPRRDRGFIILLNFDYVTNAFNWRTHTANLPSEVISLNSVPVKPDFRVLGPAETSPHTVL